jgi:hypothetical protein
MVSLIHIDKARLEHVLNIPELFIIDKIRHNTYIDARACVMRQYDPWKIYFNPLLLLEMQDKEREFDELQQSQNHPNLLDIPKPFTADQQPIRRRHNAILYARQLRSATGIDTVSATSDLPVRVKHVLMLAILLVHEACHLVNFHLSSNFSEGNIKSVPQRDFPGGEMGLRTLDDFGHMMERIIFGYVIQHAFDDILPSRFAIEDIIGMYGHVGAVLRPNSSLLQLINDLLDNPQSECTVFEGIFRLEKANDSAIEALPTDKKTTRKRTRSHVRQSISRVLFVQSICDEGEKEYLEGDERTSSFDIMTSSGRI